jgi:hypothetical protein
MDLKVNRSVPVLFDPKQRASERARERERGGINWDLVEEKRE